jgi:hypothetical protein
MFAAPSVFYGISLLRKNSYDQHTFLLAGEAVLDSEILTSVMKDVDRRMKPYEVPLNGDFSDTWPEGYHFPEGCRNRAAASACACSRQERPV